MTHRNVHCCFYQKELPGLAQPPFPGPAGEKVFQEVSAAAWAEWMKVQTMLINERQLVLTDPKARAFLGEQREKFLNREPFCPR